MISKAMIKFWSKFQIHIILLQFCRRAEKVTKIKLMRVLLKSFDKSYDICSLHILGYYFTAP